MDSNTSLGRLIACGSLLSLICLAITWLSSRFAYGAPLGDRPIIVVLSLLAIAFVIYLVSIRLAIRAQGNRRLLPVVVLFAVVMRLVLLFSQPILEIDIYRYLWDGQSTLQSVSPFRFSPQEVIDDTSNNSLSPDLQRLVRASESSAAINSTLHRVHFPELTTVYPPVSQFVFAISAWSTPANAVLSTHLVVMKFWIVLFDLATFFVLIQILRYLNQPVGWSLAYAWCPLVLKEFANSGHLDSIAVSLTTVAVYLMLRGFYPRPRQWLPKEKSSPLGGSLIWPMAAAIVLALAVGAKFYPVVLSLLLVVLTFQKCGLLRTVLVTSILAVVSIAVCWPMFQPQLKHSQAIVDDSSSLTLAAPVLPPVPPSANAVEPPPAERPISGAGLTTFLSSWKMNDFLFLILSENLSPMDGISPDQRPWFLLTTESWRQTFVSSVSQTFPVTYTQTPFVVARLITVILFMVVAVYVSWRAVRTDHPRDFLQAVFLTLAWFWLLLPTQNPWYWIWALPFVPFAQNRAWLAVSGLTFVYYLRFWLAYHWPESMLPYTKYNGANFFDFVVTWIEFGPWFLWLAGSSLIKKWKSPASPAGT